MELTTTANIILNTIISCQIACYEAPDAPCDAVVSMSNLRSLKPEMTKWDIKRAVNELRQAELIELKWQARPAVMSSGYESMPELLCEALPPLKGYGLAKKGFESKNYRRAYKDWEETLKKWAESH